MSRAEAREQPLDSIKVMLNYLVDTGEKPVGYGGVSATEAEQKRKGKYVEYPMRVFDGRPLIGQLALEREGFVLVKHETRMKNFYDEDEVRSVYYEETEELVRQTAGAKRVLVFDHTLRSADMATREAKQISGPVRNAHNDYTEWSGPQLLRDLLPDQAEELLQKRFAVVQTWRPINNPVEREPLAIADARSIGTKELVGSSRVYPNRVGEVYHLTHIIPSTAGTISPTCNKTKPWSSNATIP